jgi:23S rRNA pseudouridine1911/1915/1917 synthase
MTMTRNPSNEHRWAVVDDDAGERIDSLLASRLSDVSRAQIQRAAKAGALLVDGQPVRVSHRVSPGEVLEVSLIRPHDDTLAPAAEDIPLNVVYEDEAVIVINKPAGMVVHPAAGNWSGTLVNALLGRGAVAPASGGSTNRPGIVHRLDKGTSGLLICARTESAHRKLSEQLKSHTLARIYLAVAWGHMKTDTATFEGAIGRSQKNRKKMAVLREGREARTHVRVVERLELADLLEITLETGRTHQIRVHLSHAGHPVVGDTDYNGGIDHLAGIDPSLRLLGRRMLTAIGRPALHAYRIRFVHPVDGLPRQFEAAPPADFTALVDSAVPKARQVRTG